MAYRSANIKYVVWGFCVPCIWFNLVATYAFSYESPGLIEWLLISIILTAVGFYLDYINNNTSVHQLSIYEINFKIEQLKIDFEKEKSNRHMLNSV